MLIESQTLKTLNPQVDISLLLEVLQYHGNPLNKHALPDLLWRLKVRCIIVSLDIFVVDTIQLNNLSLIDRVISIDYVKSKDNVANLFTKGLSREQVYKSSRGM